MRKKLIIFLVLVIALTACQSADKEEYYGQWTLVSGDDHDRELAETEIQLYTLSGISFYFYEDMTYQQIIGTTVETGTWSVTYHGVELASDAPQEWYADDMELRYVDSQLMVTTNLGSDLFFSKIQ